MRLLSLAIVFCAIAACSGSPIDSDPQDPEEPPPGTVIVEPTSFRPATITIAVGDSVRWDNDAGDAHTITPISHTAFPRVEFDGPGRVLAARFTVAGTYRYFCEFHGGMNGTVVVQ